MPVHDASQWTQAERDAAVDWVFDHPHRFTVEDIEWAQRHLRLSEPECRAVFKGAARLGVVSAEGLPAYIFAVPNTGIVSTASEARLEQFRLSITKDLIRFNRSDVGRAMLRNTTGHVEISDLDNGSVRSRWLEAIGYRKSGTIEFQGQTFLRFTFEG